MQDFWSPLQELIEQNCLEFDKGNYSLPTIQFPQPVPSE